MKSSQITLFGLMFLFTYNTAISQVPATTHAYQDSRDKLNELNTQLDESEKTPLGADVRSLVQEPCGHRWYNPSAFNPEYQRLFEDKMHTLIREHRKKAAVRNQQIIQIPVVVHVIHQGQGIGEGENISEAQIQSQIQSLNDAFNRTAGTRYANTDNTAGLDYNQLTASSEIEFVLASVDPQGNSSDGINRVEAIQDYHFIPGYINDIIKPATVWNPSYYLNLWSTRLTDGVRPGLLGYAVFPTMSELEGLGFLASVPNADGIVCDYRTVGSNAYVEQFDLNPAYQYGVTTIHEVGHFLGLRHIWGDGDSEDTGCNVDDFVDDTPNAAWRSSGCNLNETCESVDLKENYMDYGSDVCKNLMTNGQNERMVTVLENSPRRNSLTTSPVLSGNPPPAAEVPSNDLCANAISIACGQTRSGSTDNSTVIGAFTGLDGRLCSGASTTHGVWFSFSGEGNEVSLKTSGSGTDYDASIHVFTGPCDDLVCVGGHDDGSAQFSNSGSDLIFLAQQGESYFIYVSGYQGETGSFSLNVSCTSYNSSAASANDTYTQAEEIACGTTIDGSTNGSSIDAIGSGDCGVDLSDKGVWYKFVGTDELISVSTCTNISFDTKLAIFEGFDSFWGCFAQNDNGGGCEKGSSKKFFGAAGKIYLIWVGGSEEGDFTLTLTCEPAPEAPVNIVFSKQQQIDSFAILFPATTEIVGDVIISHELVNKSTIIHNLQPLSQLTSIGGNLIIQENIWDAFNSLDGLESITTIGGDLIIQDNAALRSLEGLKNLTAVNGNLVLSGFSIQTFEPLSNLSAIGGNLELYGRRIHRGIINDFTDFDNLELLGGSLILDGFWTMDTLSGFGNLASIPGDLDISQMWSSIRDSGLVEIQAFDELTVVGGDIVVSNNDTLTNVRGFNKLTRVDGNLDFTKNENLLNVGFDRLEDIGGHLKFSRNNNLQNLGTFQNLISIENSLLFENNDGMKIISGMPNLIKIGGDFVYEGGVIDGPLESMTGFNNLQSIGGDFNIRSGTLTSISGMNSLDSIGGDIWLRFSKINKFDGMQSLRIIGDSLFMNNAFGDNPIVDFLPGLEKVGKTIFFDFNLDVPTFDGFHNLKEVGEDLVISKFNRALSISGFEQVESIKGSMWIDGNLFTEAFDGFHNLQEIEGTLAFIDNSSLTSVNGFGKLNSISGNLTFDGSFKKFQDVPIEFPKLQTIGQKLEFISTGIAIFRASELSSIGSDFYASPFNFDLDTFELTSLETIGGSFVFDSSGITKLIGLNNLKTIGGDLIPSTSLFGFDNTTIQSVGGDFILDTMRFLRDVDELESLQSVGGDLIIRENPKLENLTGLSNLMTVSSNLTIQKNPVLNDCQGICTVLNQEGVAGTITLSDNLEGCLTLDELKIQCAATSADFIADTEIQIFPNPAQNEIHITTNGLVIDAIELQDLIGQSIAYWPQNFANNSTIEISTLPPGIYIIKMIDVSNRQLSKKIIKY